MEKPEDIVNHLKGINKSLEDLINFTRSRIEWMNQQMGKQAQEPPKPMEKDESYYRLVSLINSNLN